MRGGSMYSGSRSSTAGTRITSLTFNIINFGTSVSIGLPQGAIIPARAVVKPRDGPEILVWLDHVRVGSTRPAAGVE